MKKTLKNLVIFTSLFAVSIFSSYFITLSVIQTKNELTSKEKFFNELKTLDDYSIKKVYININDNINNHKIDVNLKDCKINLSSLNDEVNISLDSKISINLDYSEFLNAGLTFLDNEVFLKSCSELLGDENISFKVDTISNLISSLTNSTILENGFSLDDLFNFNLLNNMYNSLKETKNSQEMHCFLIELNDYDSAIEFVTDEEYKLMSLETTAPLRINQSTTINIKATDILKEEQSKIEKPKDSFKSIDVVFDVVSNLISRFDKTNGKGVSINIGDYTSNTPLLIKKDDKPFISFIGRIDVLNKQELDDYKFILNGLVELYLGSFTLKVNANAYLIDGVIYFETQTNDKGSIKLDTIESVLNSTTLDIPNMIYSLIDALGISKEIDDNYKLFKEFNIDDDSIELKLHMPFINQEENKSNIVDIKLDYDKTDNSFDKLYIPSISIENIDICDFSLSLNEEIATIPNINIQEYPSFDEFIINLFKNI